MLGFGVIRVSWVRGSDYLLLERFASSPSNLVEDGDVGVFILLVVGDGVVSVEEATF